MRRLELAGFTTKDSKWFLNDAIGDTNFRGFVHNEKRFYVYLGRIDNEADIQNYMDDLGVVLYRTEQKRRELITKKEFYKNKIETTKAEEKPSANPPPPQRRTVVSSYYERTVKEYDEQISDIDSKLSQMSKIVVAFIVIPDIDTGSIAKRTEEMIGANPQYEVAVGTREEMVISGIKIQFTAPTH